MSRPRVLLGPWLSDAPAPLKAEDGMEALARQAGGEGGEGGGTREPLTPTSLEGLRAAMLPVMSAVPVETLAMLPDRILVRPGVIWCWRLSSGGWCMASGGRWAWRADLFGPMTDRPEASPLPALRG